MPKTITDIIPPSRRRAMEESAGVAVSSAPPPPPPPPSYRDDRDEDMSRPRRRFPWGLLGIAAAVVVICLGLIYAFSGAKIEVTAAENPVTVAGDFSATPGAGDLPFEVVTVEKVGTKEVVAEGSENANDPAQGSVVIYNEQEKVQELIKNTRFETPDGLIFRIHESVKVPAGSAAAPGQLKATVYADAGGEKYNIGPSAFTLPGLTGSDAFEQVYAKSEGSMTGGFSGTRPSVSEKTRTAQSADIQSGLEGELRDEVATKVPEGYALVPGAFFVSYQPLPSVAGEGGKVKVQEKGTATAYIFPKDALAKAIGYQTIGTYAGQPVTLPSVEGLALATAGGEPPVLGAENFPFSLSGNATILWVVDAEKIAGSIAGKSRNAAETILAGFPEVEKAVLSLKPFWAGSFPDDPAKIKVILRDPKGD